MKSRSLTHYSAIACIIALVGCSSSDDSTATDSGSDTGSAGSSGADTGAEARADVVARDVSTDASIEGSTTDVAVPDATVDVRVDATTPSEASSDADAPDVVRVDGGGPVAQPAEVGAADAGQDAPVGQDDATADTSAPADPDAEPVEGSSSYVRPGCTPPGNLPGVLATSSTILNMEGSGMATQAVSEGAGNWNETDVEPPDAGVRNPTGAYVTLAPPRGTSQHAIHSFGSGFGYPSTVVLALLETFLQPLNASQYPGITFYAKGSTATTSLTVEASLTTTLEQYCRCDPGEDGGASRCNDNPQATVDLTTDWKQFTLTWAQLKQTGYGNAVPTDPSQLLNFVFRPNINDGAQPGTWDFWLDDVSFTTP